MKKFIVLYHAPKGWAEQMSGASQEDMKKGMEAWMQWAQACGEGLLDIGAPLSNAQTVSPKGVSQSASTVVGYSILQAKDMQSASAMLLNHPHTKMADSCTIEVHEVMPVPGM